MKFVEENFLVTVDQNEESPSTDSDLTIAVDSSDTTSPSDQLIFNEDDEKKIKQKSQSKMISIELQPQSPKCITSQPSFVINSLMPVIPNKNTTLEIDDEEDRKSVDHYIITTNEQFENIHRQNEDTSDETLIVMNSRIYNDEQSNWAYYSTKPDVFASTLQSDLPIIYPDDDHQHLSLKQTFLSHFHRRRKMPLANNSLLFNEIGCIHSLELSSVLELQHEQSSWNLICKRSSKHMKRGTFRVRKSRIINSSAEVREYSLRNKFILPS